MSESLNLVWDLALVLHVRVEELEIVGVQHPAEATGKPTPVGRKTQQVALLNFLLQLRPLKLHPREVFDDVLDVVEKFVGGDSDHEQSLLVKREVFVLGVSVCWVVCVADLTLTETRLTTFGLNFRPEL